MARMKQVMHGHQEVDSMVSQKKRTKQGLLFAYWGALIGFGVSALFWVSELAHHMSDGQAPATFWNQWFPYFGLVWVPLGAWVGHRLDSIFELLWFETVTDALTGLYTRRYFLPRLESELLTLQRTDSTAALLTIDVDNLKWVNDSYGHDSGDNCIRRVAHALRSASRGNDVIARMGGDEFTVLAPYTSTTDAKVLAERIQRMLAIGHKAEGSHNTTVSIGITELSGHDSLHASEAMHRSDQLLLLAKRAGKTEKSEGKIQLDEQSGVTGNSPCLLGKGARRQRGHLHSISK